MKDKIKGSLTLNEFVEVADDNKKVWFVSHKGILKEFEFTNVNKVVKYAGLQSHRFYKLYVNVFRYADDLKLDRTIRGLEAGNIFDHYSKQGFFFSNRSDMSAFLKHKLSTIIRKHPKRLDLLVDNFPELLV